MENYADFETSPQVIQHSLQGLIVKSIGGESTQANDLSHILEKCVCCVKSSKYNQRFITLQKTFKTAAQINEELKITDFAGAFCPKNSNFEWIVFLIFFGNCDKYV